MEFVEVFANRRRELVLALTIHTAVAVDEVNVKLTTNDQRTAELIQRYVPGMVVIHPATDNSD